MNHLMIDFETLSLRNDARLLSIGMVGFTKDTIIDPAYKTLNIEGHVNQDTLMFWFKQTEAARSEIYNNTPLGSIKFLNFFRDSIADWENTCIWSNGADFDIAILTNLYYRAGVKPPYNYKNTRCFRTINSCFPLDYEDTNLTKHSALDDAFYQAKKLQKINKYYDLGIL